MRVIIAILFLCQFFNVFGQNQDIRCFVFGHSLLDHRPPINATPSDETTVAHWVYLLAQTSGNSFAAGGQYGFLAQHANLPPFSQWGYDIVPGVWDSDIETFEEAKINAVLITAANFVQYQAADLPYEDPNNVDQVSPVSATEEIVDWVSENTAESSIYIYENWPDMAGVLGDGSYPPSPEGLTYYNEFTQGDFHDWWIDYQDQLLSSRPEINVRMIPVGPLIAEVVDKFLSDLPVTELYEDDAPHGRANVYFLAGLATYMSIYEEKASAEFDVPDLIDVGISSQYSEIVDFMWDYLLEFNDDEGNSRVFSGAVSSTLSLEPSKAKLFPNPVSDALMIKSGSSGFNAVIRNVRGERVVEVNFSDNVSLDVSGLLSGLYFVELRSQEMLIPEILKFVKL